MASYGFQVKNNNSQVIISDQFDTLHFAGKATRVTNNGYTNNDIPGYSGNLDALNGSCIQEYRITISGSHTNGVVKMAPLVFIKPNASHYDKQYAVIYQQTIGNADVWKIVIMISKTNIDTVTTVVNPELYCFISSTYVPKTADPYGLVVYKADGITTTFDSRAKPLAIRDTIQGNPPTIPGKSGVAPTVSTGYSWNYAINDYDFSTIGRQSYHNASNTVGTNTMFATVSVAGAVYRRQIEGYKKSCNSYGGDCQEHWSTAKWWAMYRGVTGFNPATNQVSFGWGIYASGYAFSSAAEGTAWYDGGASSYEWSTGSMPYMQKTINNTQANVCILADSTLYN